MRPKITAHHAYTVAATPWGVYLTGFTYACWRPKLFAGADFQQLHPKSYNQSFAYTHAASRRRHPVSHPVLAFNLVYLFLF